MVNNKNNILAIMPPDKRSRLLGDILTLMTASSAHADYKIKHFSEVVLPPVQLNQYRIYHDASNRPVGFVSWAKFSKEVEDKFLNESKPLTLEEWASGDIIYIMEFIAPFGHAKRIISDLKKHYPNHKAHAVRFNPATNCKKLMVFASEGNVIDERKAEG
ncbi:MAG: toxin-activating lysine-acyltransferase [Rickettsiales bacterium]